MAAPSSGDRYGPWIERAYRCHHRRQQRNRQAIAQGLAAEGVNVVLLARGKEMLDQAADEIKRANNVQTLAVPTDITDMEAVKAAAATTAERFDAVHIVVNNVHNRVRRPGRQLTWSDKEWLEDVDAKTIVVAGQLILRRFVDTSTAPRRRLTRWDVSLR